MEIDFARGLSMLGAEGVDGAQMARDLEDFLQRVNNIPGAKTGALGHRHVAEELGLVEVGSLPHQGDGQTFIAIWNMGSLRVPGGEYQAQEPLVVRLTSGTEVTGNLLLVDYIDVARIDVNLGVVVPVPIDLENYSQGEITLDANLILKPR